MLNILDVHHVFGCCFLEQGTLLTLLQSTQLLNGNLMLTWEAAHPAVTFTLWKQISNTAVHVLLMYEVQMGLQVPTPSLWGMVQSTSSVPVLHIKKISTIVMMEPSFFNGNLAVSPLLQKLP